MKAVLQEPERAAMPPLGFPVEDELLLQLVHDRQTLESNGRLRVLLEASPDWTALLRQAEIHGVVPLVAHHLHRLDLPGVPPAVTNEFRRRALVHCGRNLLLARELRQVLECLMTAGIPVIPLKGIALASALYGPYLLRVSGDIDLLVRRADVGPAVGVLEARGYRAEGPWQYWAAAAYHIEIPLLPRGEGRRSPLDLHWGLIGGDARNAGAAEELWAAARLTRVLGVEAFAMSPEWELLFLALHAGGHLWQGLKWLVDIQEICQSWPLDWPSLWALARKWGWEEMLRLTIGACQLLWELPPAHGAGSIPWPSWLPQFPAQPFQGRWARLRVMYRLFPRWSLRIGYLVRVISTPSPIDYRWLPLPSALWPLYFFLRPLRWVVMGARWCVRTALQRLGA